nr:thioredoxin domain-containing protein [Endozoicomonas sp.]
MKKLLLVLMFVFPMMAFANATDSNQNASQFQEGTHYEVIKGLPPFTKPTVTEFFSVYCGGCYQWEYGPLNTLKAWLGKQNFDFKQAHMTFMGNYADQASTALAITEGTPRSSAIKKALFNRIHVERKGDWKNDKEFFQSMKQAGLSEAEYQSMKNSLPVAKTRMDWKRYGKYVQSVPSFMVNNRYLINMGSLKSHDDLNALITYLNNLPVENKK